ncbi:MAG: cell division/cell wall cluster transcriptional repressor MraZ [Roseococcus sp.]|nr:cell division/cell wall cluster transcriptional repressor MraZ [Roseococcus sp.]
MTQFRGKFTNGLDKKGRCSVPASFRARLAGDALVLRRSVSPDHCYIEAWPAAQFDAASRDTNPLNPLSPAQDAEDYAYVVDVAEVTPDPDGRIILPRDFIEYAGLTDEVAFLGRLNWFELWQPAAADRRIEEARRALAARAAAAAA